MKTTRTPVIAFGTLCIGFLLFVKSTVPRLPEPVASHFGITGHPDGWMARSTYSLSISITAIVLPLFIIGLTYLTRLLPDWMINLPHKEFWLSPEQRPHTHAFVLVHSLWLGCLILCLLAGGHYLTLQASRNQPAVIPDGGFIVLMTGFLAAMGIWLITFVRHFRKPPALEPIPK